MKTKFLIGGSLVALMGLGSAICAYADEKGASSPENFLRNSVYTVLIKSEAQNQWLNEESKKEGSGAKLIKGFAGKSTKAQKNENVAAAPQDAFLELEIPEQFYDHNGALRVVDFDKINGSLKEDYTKMAEEYTGKKKSNAFGNFMGSVAKSVAGVQDDNSTNANKTVKEKSLPVMFQWLDENNVPTDMLARWFRTPGDASWDNNLLLITERGMGAATEEQKLAAAQQGLSSGIGQGVGMTLVPNTFLLAFNLGFRSNAAIVAEAEKYTNAALSLVGGASAGGAATELLGGAASAIAGEGYSVQAKAFLFQLDWDNDKMNDFAENYFGKNCSMEDLIKSGLCKVKYLGTQDGKASCRMSILNEKESQEDLIKRATARAIDDAIVKLQSKHESFRTSFPVFKSDGQGNLMAKVGLKEGICKGDEYEILEKQEDAQGRVSWKKIGSVKVKDNKQVWDNRYGAADDAMAAAQAGAEASKEVDVDSAAVNLGYTTFVGGKKGQDYSGYYLRLKKKK